jgi:fibronectin-binding autotransporter adhesin
MTLYTYVAPGHRGRRWRHQRRSLARTSPEQRDIGGVALTVTTGARAAGAGLSVLVTTPGGTNAANTLYTYEVTPSLTWTNVTPMNTARVNAAAVVLNDGKVLVTGGPNGTAERYDPVAGTWTTINMVSARWLHRAEKLADGRVLVIAGAVSGTRNALNTAEIYDPATGTFSAVANLAESRETFASTVLSNGKVLVHGGWNGSSVRSSGEVYDPATNTWTATGASVPRNSHELVTLPNGKVLMISGHTGAVHGPPECYLYDPAANTWAATGSMGTGRAGPRSVVLANGKVLTTGESATSELYDPATGTWSYTGSMSVGRGRGHAILLGDGQVLAFGGVSYPAMPVSTEIYNPATGTWSATGSAASGRSDGVAVRLQNGVVLAAGGSVGTSVFSAPASANVAIFDAPPPPPAATVASISPSVGSTAGGTSVTITGTNLTGATAVTIGGVAATLGTNTGSTLTVTTGARAAGAGLSVLVTTPGGTNAANTLYTYTGPVPNTAPSFTLPAGVSTPAGETWTTRESDRNWRSITSSADGSKLAALVFNGQIYTSTDSGVSWTARDSNRNWQSITSSADGSKLAAVVDGGQIYTSTDSGVSWTTRDSNRNWQSITSSADGGKLSAVVNGGQIYTSTDSGLSWTARESNRTWRSITSSSDGSKLAAVVNGGQIYTSTDSGVSWTARDSNRNWQSITSSADGGKLAAVVDGGQIYTSTDSGLSWTARETNRSWWSITSSADGSRLAVVVKHGQIHTSTDSGLNWTAREDGRYWSGITSSADGSKLAAVVSEEQILTSVGSSTLYNLSVSAGSGLSTIPAFATNISPGPVADAGQTVSFTVTNNNNALFTTQPAIASNGTLTFTPGSTPGVATVTVNAVDSGGVSAGGTDTSPAQTFTITVTVGTPTVASISPSVGSTAGGTSVTITGTNLTGATAVTIGGVAATLGTNTGSTLTVTTGARAAGAGLSVLVTTPGGTNAANTLFTYAVPTNVALSKPVIRVFGEYSPAFSASRVTDGSTFDSFGNNYWITPDGQGIGAFFTLDLQGVFNLTEIRLRNTNNTSHNDRGTGGFRILASNSVNGSNQLISPQTILTGTLTQGSGTLVSFTTSNGFTAGNYRYLHFIVDSLAPWATYGSAGLNEIEAFGVAGVAPPNSAPTVASPTSTALTATTATLGGNVSSDGGAAVTARGVVYSLTATNSSPQIGGIGVTNVVGTGTTGVFTVNATGLTASSGYSYAAYATNSAGTSYSSVGTFTTTASFDTTSGSPLTYAGIISGAVDLTKTGPGVLILTGANTYTGITTVSQGALNIQNNTALGTVAGGTSVTAGAALQIQGGITTSAEALTLNGTGVSADGALRNISGNNDFTGLVTLGSATRINSDAGTLTLSNTGTITGAGLGLTVGGAGNTTINSAIGTTTGTLTKDGTGTLTLTGANTYSGGTTVSEGTIVLGNQNGFGTGTVTLANGVTFKTSGFEGNSAGGALPNAFVLSGGTVNVDVSFGAKDIWINTGVSGSGGFSVTGTGGIMRNPGLMLSGAKTFQGGVTIADQTRVTIDHNASLGTGGLQAVSGTGTLRVAGNVSGVTNSVAVASGATLSVEVDSGLTGVLSGVISGSGGSLTKNSAGTLTLSGANTYTGATTISAGTLQIGNGGTAGSLSTSSAITNNATLAFNRSNTITQGTDFNSVISGTGALTQAGSGTLVLNGTNSYSGVTTAAAGVLRLNSAGALPGGIGTSGGTSALTLSGGVIGLGVGDFTRDLGTGVSQVQWMGSGGFAAYGANRNVNLGGAGATVTWGSGSFVPHGSALILGAADATHKITFQNAINFGGATRTIQVIKGTSGSFDAKLEGALSNGSYLQTGDGSLEIAGNVSGASYEQNATNGSLNLTSAITTTTFTQSGAGSITSVSGLGSIGSADVNLNAGTITLSNSELNTALITDLNPATANDIVINGGALVIGASEQIGNNGSLVLTTGSFGFSGSGLTETLGTFTNNGGTFSTGANTLVGTGNTITWAGGTNTVNDGGNVQDAHIVISGGTNTVEGGATGGVLQLLTGGTGLEMSAGSTLTLNSDNAVAGKLLLQGNVSITGNSTVTIASGLALTNSGNVDLDAGTRTLTVADGTAADDLLVGAVITNGSLTKAGAGTMNLAGLNTYAGTTTVSAGTLSITGSINSSATIAVNGGLLSTSGADKLANTAAVTVGGGTLTLGGNDTVTSLTLTSGTIGGSATLTATGSYALQGGTVNGNLGAGTINSSGTVALNGTAGALAVNVTAGMLTLGSSDRLADGATVTVSGGTLRQAGPSTDTVATFNMSSGLFDGSGTLTATNSYELSGGTVFGNLGTGTINSSGTVTLNGSTAATVVNVTAGTLTYGSSNRLADGATVTVSGTGILNVGTFTDTVSIFNMSAGSLNGTGTLTAGTYGLSGGTVTGNLGGGTLNSSGNVALNGTAGATTVNISAGTLTLGSANRLADTAAVNLTGGTLAIGAFDDTVGAVTLTSGSITGSGGVLTGSSYDVRSGSVSAILGGSGRALTKTTAGTVALSGANTYTGATTISAGTLTLSGSGALSDSSAVDVNGATGIFDISGISAGGETIGSLAGVASSSVVLGGKNLTAGGDGTSTIFTGVLSGTGGSLTKAGTGTLTLNGASTYTGLTTVSAGILNLQNATGLGTTAGATTVSNGATLQLQGGITVGAEALSLNGGAASGQSGALVNVSGTNTYGGAVTVAASSSISAASGSVLNLTGGVDKSGTVLTFNGGGTINVSTLGITGASANSDLVVNGVTVNMGVANTYNGPTFIRNSGTLNANVTNALPTANGRTAVTFDGTGTSVLTLGAAQSVASLTSAGAATLTLNSSTLTVGAASGSTSFAGLITGTGGLIKDGNSTQILANSASTFSGNVAVQVGILRVSAGHGGNNNTSAIGLPTFAGRTITVSSGANLQFAADNVLGGSNVTPTASIIVNGGTFENTGNFFSRIGALTLNGGTLNAVGGNSTGFGSWGFGSTVTVGGSAASTISASGTNSFINLNATTTFSVADATGDANTDLLVAAVLADQTASQSGAAASLVKSGAGTMTMSGANTYSGTTTVSAGTLSITGDINNSATLSISGGLLSTSGANKLSNSAAVTVSGGTLTIGGNDAVTSLTLTSGTIGGSATLTANTYGLQGGFVNGNLGAGVLTKSTGGSVTLNGTAAAATVNITGGTLTLGSAERLADTAAVTVNGGALDIGAFNEAVGSVQLTSGSITGSGGTLTSAGTYDVRAGSVSAILGGTVGLTKTTGGTVTLSGSNTYTGTTTISAGTLGLSGAGQLSDSSAVVVNGGSFDIGSVSDTVAGVQLTSGSITGSSGVLTSSSTFDVQGGSVSAILGGSVGLTKTTAGTVTLSGTNTYTGATLLSAGDLVVNGSIGSSSLTTIDGGTLRGTGTVGAIQLNSGGAINPAGLSTAGTLNTGNIAIVDGQLRFNLGGAGAGQYDQLNTTGTINLAAGGAGAKLVLDAISGYVATLNDAFTLAINDVGDAITGKFAKVTTSGTHVVTISGVDYVQNVLGSNYYGRINYAGDSSAPASLTAAGNDLVLKVVTPEITVTEAGTTLSDNGGYDFGDVDKLVPAVPLTKTFTITNDGEVDLMNIVITAPIGAAAGDYSIDTTGTATNLVPANVPGTNSTTFTVTFDPQRIGTRNAYISITSNDLDETTFDIPLSGMGAIGRDILEPWTNIYASPTAPSEMRDGAAVAVAVQKSTTSDGAVAVFATGYTSNASINRDIYTAKYDPVTGLKQWEVIFNGAANGHDEGRAIVVDGNGDVVITGYTSNSSTNTDAYVAKYAGADGQLLWQKIYAGAGNGIDGGNSVAVDSANHVAVAGYGTAASGAALDIWAARYTASGGVTFERLYDGGASREDLAYKVAVDTAGDLAVAGYAGSATTGKNFRVLHLAAGDGNPNWQYTKNGSSNTDDLAYDVTFNATNQVVATGTARATNFDFYTVKLSSGGGLLWERQWNSSFNSSDASYDVAVDGNGDVIVGGASYQFGDSSDGYVAKYNGTSGALVWDRRFTGAGVGLTDVITKLDLDVLNNVMVTGYTGVPAASVQYDILTAKMLADDGGLLWQRTFNGIASKHDLGLAVAVSPDGNVYVGGYTTAGPNATDFLLKNYQAEHANTQNAQTITFANPGVQSAGIDLALSATASSGLTVRFAVTSGPAVISDSNNALVRFTGEGDVTIRATQQGNSQLARATPVSRTFRVNKSNQIIDFTLPGSVAYNDNTVVLGGVATSGLGITYGIVSGPGVITGRVLSFTGSGLVTVSANQAGDARFNAAAEVQRGINASNTAPVIIPAGVEQGWLQTYAGSGASEGHAVALQIVGNNAVASFVAGSTTNAGSLNIYLMKFNNDGSAAWGAPVVINGAGSGADEALAVAVDAAGDVYISGYVTVGAGNTDIYVAKFSGVNGANAWSRTFAGTAGRADAATGLVLEGTANVVIGGYANNTGTGNDFFAAKLNQSDGLGGWSRSVNSSGAGSDVANAVAVGADGDVALAGVSSNDAWTVQLESANGNTNWSRRYNALSKPDAARGVLIDVNNDVIITAFSQASNYNIYTAKYSRLDGAIVWEQTYNSSFNSSDAPWAAALDPNGNVIIVGTSYTAASVPDSISLKYDGASGSLLWQQRYNGPASKADEHYAVAVDANGNPVVTGYSLNSDNTSDIYTAKLAGASGVPLWESRFNGSANKSDAGRAVAADPTGRAWIAGHQSNASNVKELLHVKYQPVGAPPPPLPFFAPDGDEALAAAPPPPSGLQMFMEVEQGDTAHFAAGYYDAEGNSSVEFSAVLDGLPAPAGALEADPLAGAFEWEQDTSTLAPGAHEVVITATDTAGASAHVTLHVNVTSNFADRAWRYANFGSTSATGNAADDADPDGDGVSNLAEFAFGLNPTRAGSDVGIRAEAAGQQPQDERMRAVFLRRKDHAVVGLDYEVEFSSNLIDWTPSTAIPEVIADEGVLEKVGLPFPILPNGQQGRFFRIQLHQPTTPAE